MVVHYGKNWKLEMWNGNRWITIHDGTAKPRRWAIRSLYEPMLPTGQEIKEAIFAVNTTFSMPVLSDNDTYIIVVDCVNKPEPLRDGLIDWIELCH